VPAIKEIETGAAPHLHAMKEMDDGRFNKVANIIGQSSSTIRMVMLRLVMHCEPGAERPVG